MRRSLRSVLIGSAAIATAGVTTLVVWPAHAATGAITNPGFESGLSGWSCASTATAGTGNAHGGSQSLIGAATSGDNAKCTQSVTVTPNTKYTLSGYVNGAYVFIGATGTGGTDPSTWTPTTGGTYQQLSTEFTTGAATTSVTVYVNGWYGQGTYYADDFELAGPGGTTPTTTATASPSATTPSATPTSAAPTSTPPSASASATPTPTATTTAPSTSLPKHELTGYWQNFTNGAANLRLKDVSADYDMVAVAFADTDATKAGAVTFNVDSGLSSALGGYTNADLKSDITALHARGVKVVLSVGGQNGTVSVGDATAAENFASSVYSLMQSFGFDGVDIDLENGVNPDSMSTALHSLRTKAGANLIITMAPETIFMQSSGATYLSLALKTKDILTVVHTQYYNSGSMLGCDGKVYSQGSVDFITAQACIAIQAGLSPSQVALGLPASTSAAGGGYVAPSVVNAALDCLTKGTSCGSYKPAQTWPTLRGAMTWSVNWDKTNGNAFSSSVGPHLDTLP
jgi:chitinase